MIGSWRLFRLACTNIYIYISTSGRDRQASAIVQLGRANSDVQGDDEVERASGQSILGDVASRVRFDSASAISFIVTRGNSSLRVTASTRESIPSSLRYRHRKRIIAKDSRFHRVARVPVISLLFHVRVFDSRFRPRFRRANGNDERFSPCLVIWAFSSLQKWLALPTPRLNFEQCSWSSGNGILGRFLYNSNSVISKSLIWWYQSITVLHVFTLMVRQLEVICIKVFHFNLFFCLYLLLKIASNACIGLETCRVG